jgi:hypothetical protein
MRPAALSGGVVCMGVIPKNKAIQKWFKLGINMLTELRLAKFQYPTSIFVGDMPFK